MIFVTSFTEGCSITVSKVAGGMLSITVRDKRNLAIDAITLTAMDDEKIARLADDLARLVAAPDEPEQVLDDPLARVRMRRKHLSQDDSGASTRPCDVEDRAGNAASDIRSSSAALGEGAAPFSVDDQELGVAAHG